MSSRSDQPVDRGTRRRTETRARLVNAAQSVFARQGIEATRIREITDAADVGFGSFYNHFDGKDAIAAAVMEQAAASVGAAIDTVTAEIEDPAEVVAVAHRTLIRIAAENRELGWLMVRLEISHDLVSGALRGYAARDLRRGIASGRFTVDDAEVALIATGGALLAVTRAVLNGRLGVEIASDHAAAVLRLLGVRPPEAREVAHRALPQVPQVPRPT